jgi:hypothetical protein
VDTCVQAAGPEFLPEIVLDARSVVDGPFAAPTIAGPASYDAAMSSPAWRKWLTAIHAEIKGQIAYGCWHWDWEVPPPGARVLRNVLVLTQKLHADFTVERLKARICVDGSSEKPGEYADVSAHVAQFGTFKAQVGSTAELEGTIYSGDWTQAYLFALNTVPQYMAACAILSKHILQVESACTSVYTR